MKEFRDFYEKNKKAVLDALILSSVVFFSFLFFRYLFPIFLPFILGWILSRMFMPLVNRLEKHRVPRGAGTLLAILLLFAVIGGLGWLSGMGISDRMAHFSENLPYYVEQAENWLRRFWMQFDSFSKSLPAQFETFFLQFQEEASNLLVSLLRSMGSSSLLSKVPHLFLGFIIMLISGYFFTKDRDAIHRVYVTYVEPLFGFSVENTKSELKSSLKAYVKTQFILMSYTFVICFAGMLIIRSPHPVLLSVIIAIIDALPFFGSGFILWPGALLHLLIGNTFLAVGYLVIYGVIQVMRQVMQPKILGAQIGLHPLLTLFSMYFGFCCIGVWGMILGPIIAVVLRTMFELRKNIHPHPEQTGPSEKTEGEKEERCPEE